MSLAYHTAWHYKKGVSQRREAGYSKIPYHVHGQVHVKHLEPPNTSE